MSNPKFLSHQLDRLRELNLNCPVNFLSYGITSTNITKQLQNLNVDVSLFPIGQLEIESKNENLINYQLQNAQFYNPKSPCLKIWHQYEFGQRIGKGKFVGLTIFELDPLTRTEVHHLNQLDALCVPSQWARSVCENSGVKIPVFVTPLGVDRSIFDRELYNEEPSEFWTTFLVIGKLEKRKLHEEIIECFNLAFEKNNTVRLLLAIDNVFLPKQYMDDFKKQCKETKMESRINFIDRVGSHKDIARLMCSSDCFIGCSRAEGFNMPQLEAMSMGLSIITTNNAAHTEYCNGANSYLIDIDDMEIAHDGLFFNEEKLEGGMWAKWGQRQEEQLVEQMRKVYNQKLHSKKTPINITGIQTAKQFSWQVCAEKLIKAIYN